MCIFILSNKTLVPENKVIIYNQVYDPCFKIKYLTPSYTYHADT